MKKLFPIFSVVVAILMVATAFAQVSYPDPAFGSYQVVNLSQTEDALITVTYYDEEGVPAAYSPEFPDVAPNGSVTVQQSLLDELESGRYSAVISSNQPIAAISNQQLGEAGSGTSIAPFSSYSGATEGSTEVVLPVVMHNWFGYYTEFYIQNAGMADATNIQITYNPTSIGSCVTGATGQSDTITDLPQYATTAVSQFDTSGLGAPAASGCDPYTGRFLGGATITADQPVVVVVNQYVQDKLFTYNGFTAPDTTMIAPAYMRNWFGYYASLTIANPGDTDASVTITYSPDASLAPLVNPTADVTGDWTVPAHETITIYDGPTATADQSDLVSVYDTPTERFFGSVKIVSDVPVFAMVNQEATLDLGNQAGSYNAFTSTEGSMMISVPLLQSDFYGYYTSLTIMTVDGGTAEVKITYTSDSVYSSVKDQSKNYEHTVDGFLNRYEGPTATAAQSDLLDDPAWQSGTEGKFIGSAIIEVTSGSPIVAFVNSESGTAPSADTRDSMYTYNTFNLK
jgi:hypothetical protein